jgi:hypothetical protein
LNVITPTTVWPAPKATSTHAATTAMTGFLVVLFFRT